MTVADDRLEAGTRELLNLGHTFAHAIERASSYRMTHGAGGRAGFARRGIAGAANGALQRRRAPARADAVGALRLAAADASLEPERSRRDAHDKKKRDGRLRFVLPRAIGDVEYGVECATASVRAVLRALEQATREVFVRVVDALPAIRSSRFDLPLTYDAGALELAVGDVVRVPLGSRDVLAFVVSPVRGARRARSSRSRRCSSGSTFRAPSTKPDCTSRASSRSNTSARWARR